MKKLLLTLLAISMMAFVGCTHDAAEDAAPADDSAEVVEPAADEAMEDAAEDEMDKDMEEEAK